MDFPLEDASAGGGGFGLGDMAGVLQGDGERGMGERVVGGQCDEGHGGGDGVVELASIAQSTHQAVMRFNMACVHGDNSAKGLGGIRRGSFGKQIDSELRERVGCERTGHVWL